MVACQWKTHEGNNFQGCPREASNTILWIFLPYKRYGILGYPLPLWKIRSNVVHQKRLDMLSFRNMDQKWRHAFFRKMNQKRLKIKKKTPCLFGRGKKLKVFWVYLPLYQKFYRLIVFLKITRRETTTLSTTLYPMQERRPAENGWNKGCLHFEHHTCVPSFPLVWSYLEMTRLGEPTLFPFEESLRKERLWLNVSCLIRKCHGLKYTNISSSLLLKSNERVHLGCFKSDTLWRKKLQCQYNPLQGIYKPYPKEFFS